MKKLKTKVFLTIVIILSFFLIGTVLIYNYKNYDRQKKSITSALRRVPISIKKEENYNEPNFDGPKPESNNQENKVFLDFKVYTILMDDNNNYIKIINHTENEVDETEIKKIFQNIISTHKSGLFIGNLYLNNYSYSFNDDNTLTIIETINIKKDITNILILSILLIVFLEIIIAYVSHLLTKWIIKPVNESFQKQKDFIVDASHELKTPLSIILASTEAFYLDKDTKWVNNINNEAERMTNLVTNLLNLAKTEKDISNSYKMENISSLLEKSVLSFEAIIFEKNIKLKYHINENITLLCDKEQFEQLIHILVDNAISYSFNNGKIIVSLEKINKGIILQIKNKGLPIKKGEEKNIFERFYRGDESRNRNSNKYGLGLAIAKNIVENFNGTITASSYSGYTTFKISFNQK